MGSVRKREGVLTGLLSVCNDRTCTFSADLVPIFLLQCSHVKRFNPVCERLCEVSAPDEWNLRSQRTATSPPAGTPCHARHAAHRVHMPHTHEVRAATALGPHTQTHAIMWRRRSAGWLHATCLKFAVEGRLAGVYLAHVDGARNSVAEGAAAVVSAFQRPRHVRNGNPRHLLALHHLQQSTRQAFTPKVPCQLGS